MKNVKRIILLFIGLTTMLASSAFAACERGDPKNADTLQTVKYNLSLYFKDKSMQAKKPLSNDDACLLATNLATEVNGNLEVMVENTLFDTTKMQYEKVFGGVYYKGLQSIISNSLIMGTTPSKEAKAKLTLLWNVVKYQNNSNVDKYNFQLYVVAPYLYNYYGSSGKDIVNNTQRYGSKGSKVKACGKLICENEKVSLFDYLQW